MAPISVSPEVPRERLTEWVQRFIRHPSEQSDLMEADPAVLSFISDCARPLVEELGMTPRFDGMGNMIVEMGPADAERRLMFMTYAMTHPAASMRDPFKGELIEENGVAAIRGRGVSEQKASLAAALAAVHAYRSRGKGGGLTFVLSTAGETGRHMAAEAILGGLGAPPRLGVVVLGTSSQVALGNKGRIDIEVTVRGKAFHSSMPERGVNAITGAHEVLDRMAAFEMGEEEHAGLGRATLTSTSIASLPKATHTVQNEVRMTFDRRLLPGQDPDDAFERVRDVLDIGPPWTIEVEKGPFMYPCEVAEDSELVRHIVSGHAAAGLEAPGFMWSHGALDAGYLAERGCQATMWGPGSVDMWHSDEESISVDAVCNGANAYLGLIASYLG
jgi:acetylornithine deacetylase/succinyl-diaminopimelate desuccinylase-like protein